MGEFWEQTDAVGRAVALALLAMSVAAWVVILWKTWLLRRVRADIGRALPAFWDAAGWSAGAQRVQALDREQLLTPLVHAAAPDAQAARGTLAAVAEPEARLTRALRDALHQGLARLQQGQVLLASIGSTAPFIGLFGTVWGIYHALAGIAGEGALSIDRVAGPVGEALIMTAAGLAVAIPAVLVYNLHGQWVSACEAELEGWAHDLRALALGPRAGDRAEAHLGAGAGADVGAGAATRGAVAPGA
jgi:biopolymer transport protein ExbB